MKIIAILSLLLLSGCVGVLSDAYVSNSMCKFRAQQMKREYQVTDRNQCLVVYKNKWVDIDKMYLE